MFDEKYIGSSERVIRGESNKSLSVNKYRNIKNLFVFTPR